jgi:hypothetical protein
MTLYKWRTEEIKRIEFIGTTGLTKKEFKKTLKPNVKILEFKKEAK